MSLGFQEAGFDIVAAYDKWEAALDVYRKNFSHTAEEMDLSNVELCSEKIGLIQPDMIIGGPPCQDFSSAGKRNEDGGRGDLTISYAKIISKVRPKWFVMENVARIEKTQKLLEAKKIFKDAGYGLSHQVLDASLCGVPQKRKRFFMIGKLRETDNFMMPFINIALSEKPMTMRDYFGDTLGINYYYRHPRSYVRRGIFSMDEPSPTIRGVNRPMPNGYQVHANDPVKTKEGIRPLTTKERSMVQTFPESFVFEGSKTDVEQMVGNAVPVNLAKFIGESINRYLDNPHKNRTMVIDYQQLNTEERLAWLASEPGIL